MKITVSMVLLIAGWVLTAPIRLAHAESFRVPAVSAQVEYDDYEIRLLQIALDHAPGQHDLILMPRPANDTANQGRRLHQFADGNTPYNVIFSGYSLERESLLNMVYVPLTRGLLGHRMLFIRRETDARFAGVFTLQQAVDTIALGMPISHPERPIYEHAGFRVVTALPGAIWDLLARGRYDALLYGMDESALVLEKYGGIRGASSIVISNQVRISYSYDSFFYVRKGEEHLAAIITEGLEIAYASGAFMKHFESFAPIREGLAMAATAKRRALVIDNPFVSEKFRAIPERFWHRFADD